MAALLVLLPVIKGLLDNPVIDAVGNFLDKISDKMSDAEMALMNAKHKAKRLVQSKGTHSRRSASQPNPTS